MGGGRREPAGGRRLPEAAEADEVELVAERTLDEVLADRFAAAAARGDVIDVADTPARSAPPAAGGARAHACTSCAGGDEAAVHGREIPLHTASEPSRAAAAAAAAFSAATTAADRPGAIKSEALAAAAQQLALGASCAAGACASTWAAPPAAPAPAPAPALTPAQRLQRLPGPLGSGDPCDSIVQQLAKRIRALDLERGAIFFESSPAQQTQPPPPPTPVPWPSPPLAQPADAGAHAHVGAMLHHDAMRTCAHGGLGAHAPPAAVTAAPPPPPPVRLLRAPFPVEPARSRCARVMLGTEVLFPFKSPLPSQTRVMVAVLRALEERQACLVESPTGTGKTVALLCAALAWQRKQLSAHGAAPRILYGIRTHSQIRAVIGEFEKVPYRPAISFLASRERQCLNKDVGLAQPAGGRAHSRPHAAPAGGGNGGGERLASGRSSLNQRCRAAVRAVETARRERIDRGSWDDDDPPKVLRASDGTQCGCTHYKLMTKSVYVDALCERCLLYTSPSPRD